MAIVLLIALLVAVISLGALALSQDKTIKTYEQELINRARKNDNGNS